MPIIKLEITSEAYKVWQRFLRTSSGMHLKEIDKLGDWIILNFITNIDNLLKDDKPISFTFNQEKRKKQNTIQSRQKLTKYQKRILPMFNENFYISLKEIIQVLALTPEAAQAQIKKWIEEKFLTLGPEQKGMPTYILSNDWQLLNVVANRPSLYSNRALFL